MSSLAGKVALVTGGTSGIGAAVSAQLSAAGARVAVLSNAPREELDEAVASGCIAWGEQVDIADAEAVAQAVGRIEQELGVVTLLVNNAAIWASNPVPESPIALFDRHIDVNLKGSFYVTQAVLPGLIEAGGGGIGFFGSGRGPPRGATHHPDRIAGRGLPPAAVKLANDRVAALNAAYGRIAELRDFR